MVSREAVAVHVAVAVVVERLLQVPTTMEETPIEGVFANPIPIAVTEGAEGAEGPIPSEEAVGTGTIKITTPL